MINTSEVQGLEQQLAEGKELVERRASAIRLAGNRDFRKLILEGFCLHDAARLVAESGDPALTAQQRADALAMAQAAGHLKRFLSAAIQMGFTAERDMPQLEEALAEARAEEDQLAGEAPVEGE